MNTFWIIACIAAILVFIAGEAFAFRHPDRENTLSKSIYTIGQTWPLSIFIMGMFAGGLAVHLFWHWDPNCLSSLGNG